MKHMWWLAVLGAFVMMIALTGCDRVPADVDRTVYNKKGKCVVCKRNTLVRDVIVNPLTKYGVTICWRDDCGRKFGARMTDYVEKDKMMKPGDMPGMPGGMPGAPGMPPGAPGKMPMPPGAPPAGAPAPPAGR